MSSLLEAFFATQSSHKCAEQGDILYEASPKQENEHHLTMNTYNDESPEVRRESLLADIVGDAL